MIKPVRNVLFIMCDQLRWDYLSCYGHPTLHTPNIDALAARGVKFTRAYCQAPVCGPSRMSFYTGRYVASHRAWWNFVPLPVSERTLGDYLRPHGVRVALAGKTHMEPDAEGMRRLGIDPAWERGVLLSECGFEPWERDDGIHPDASGTRRIETNYCNWLRAKGYDSPNPWHDFANAARGANGEILSGWLMRNANLPANIAEADSETPYMVDRAKAFMEDAGDRPWLLHLSFIKPHWPYIVPAPYHDMYGPEDVQPVHRDPAERDNAHPVYAAFMSERESVNFARREVRDTVIPVYMGLIKQIDDHLGRLFAWMDERGLTDETLVVLTADHGDYLGDHWMGEKELYHEASVRLPLIVADPRPEARRGVECAALVEAIDLVPTFLDALGVATPDHVLEGRSLAPLLRGGPDTAHRDHVVSEFDYSTRRRVREAVGRPLHGCRTWMVRTRDWKYIEYDGFRPSLFDLRNDPDEFHDLGADPAHASGAAEMRGRLLDWFKGLRTHETSPDDWVAGWTDKSEDGGIRLGAW